MQLTLRTDFALRTLIYLSAHRERIVTVAEVATAYRISAHHLMKVAQALGEIGAVELLRGRNGGLRLRLEPTEINVGMVVRRMEPTFELVECFNRETNRCAISPVCVLKGALAEAQEAFLATLDRYSLEDVVGRRGAAIRKLLAATATDSA